MKQIRLGRGNECDYIINDESVSRNHGEIFVDDEGIVFYTDLSSTNGSTVNGKRIKGSTILSQGDILKLGNARPVPWHNLVSDKKVGTNPGITGERIPITNSRGNKSSEKSNSLVLILSICAAVLFIVLITFVLLKNTKENNDSDSLVAGNVSSEEATSGDNSSQKSEPEDEVIRIPTEIVHNYDCLGNDILTEATNLEEELVNSVEMNVTLSEEKNVGKQLYSAVRSEYKILNDSRSVNLTNILNNIVRQIDSPKGFTYRIYLIDSDELNAFTAGGYIFFTTEMYSFVKNNHEMAAIIGHEVAHNERGHINLQLREEKLSKLILGEIFGSDADNLRHFLTTPFNQKRESESDLYGIDYCIRAGYEACYVIGLWERMGQDEGEYDDLENLRRSHPYSSRRRDCCRSHIINNYNFSCD